MMDWIEANWWVVAIALVVAIAAAWWLFIANRRTRVVTTSIDPLDEGAELASRNQALIDSAPAAAPRPEATPTPVAAPTGDDLTRIKGLGPKLQRLLNSLGVTSYSEIAGWSEEDIDRIDAQLGDFAGRIRRDSWIEQAKLLASEDTSDYEGKFGKL